MGRNTVNLVLLALLLGLGLVGANYSFFFWKKTKELRQLQQQAAALNYQQTVIKSLLTDTVEYSKKNPAIDPILQSVGIKVGAPAPNAPPRAR